MKLRNYQWDIVRHIIDNKRCAVWSSMGSGKTLSTLVAIDTLSMLEDTFPVLVVAPLRVAKTTWPDEVAKWPITQHMTCISICGDNVRRNYALSQNADIYTVNFELLPWLVEHFGESWPFKMVVVDESTKLKSFRPRQGSIRARALAKVAFKYVNRIVLLTGTPAPQGLIDIWGQQWFIDSGSRLGKSYRAFSDRWFHSVQVGAHRAAVQLKPMPHAQKEIEALIKDTTLTVDVRDHIAIDEPFVNKIYVDLPIKAMQQYRELEREMFTELQGQEVEVFNPAAKTMKCLQMANGAVYTTEDNTQFIEVHDEKLDVLASVIAEASGNPVLVAYHFRSDLARLLKAFPQGRPLDQDPKTIADWNAGKIPLLFAHPASAGHGLNLAQGGHILAFFSVNWNLEEHLQIIERVGPIRQAQLGSGKVCEVHYIVARNTVDEMILERLISKKTVQEILTNAMKRRTT
jgi:SNF2 family DNA or RNA helicase